MKSDVALRWTEAASTGALDQLGGARFARAIDWTVDFTRPQLEVIVATPSGVTMTADWTGHSMFIPCAIEVRADVELSWSRLVERIDPSDLADIDGETLGDVAALSIIRECWADDMARSGWLKPLEKTE
jgi:hypothetical protein